MKERPILMSTPMVQAILDGRKTMTRRIIKLPKKYNWYVFDGEVHLDSDSNEDYTFDCPYGKIGDVLWVRETWQNECEEIQIAGGDWSNAYLNATGKFVYKADGEVLPKDSVAFGKWKPSIHMPREACRLRLEITDIKVGRVQDISEEDAMKEGVKGTGLSSAISADEIETARDRFLSLWESINGPDSWHSNPWVWVVSFKKL